MCYRYIKLRPWHTQWQAYVTQMLVNKYYTKIWLTFDWAIKHSYIAKTEWKSRMAFNHVHENDLASMTIAIIRVERWTHKRLLVAPSRTRYGCLLQIFWITFTLWLYDHSVHPHTTCVGIMYLLTVLIYHPPRRPLASEPRSLRGFKIQVITFHVGMLVSRREAPGGPLFISDMPRKKTGNDNHTVIYV